MATIRFGQRTFQLPTSRLIRIPIGILLILFGFLGFLPVLGFWMVPLGLLILSVDIPAVRRWRRQITVKLGVWLRHRYPKLAEKLGFNNSRPR
ncbi:MAG: hypothetical protein ACR2OM_04990 [Aestuariivirgaceae bacterium]